MSIRSLFISVILSLCSYEASASFFEIAPPTIEDLNWQASFLKLQFDLLKSRMPKNTAKDAPDKTEFYLIEDSHFKSLLCQDLLGALDCKDESSSGTNTNEASSTHELSCDPIAEEKSSDSRSEYSESENLVPSQYIQPEKLTYKAQICIFWRNKHPCGTTPCTWAHGNSDLNPDVKPCLYFSKYGNCRNGNACGFRHIKAGT